MSEAPIIVNNVAGHPVVAGQAATIRAALRGAQPLIITGRHATGDVVWLAPRTKQIWGDDAITAETTDLARTVQHAEHGEILYAWVDTARLDRAPQLAALETDRRVAGFRAVTEMEQRARDMVPACDNCGDCRLCI